MQCTKCKLAISAPSNFCPNCGKKLALKSMEYKNRLPMAITNSIGMQFRLIQAGTFNMGSNDWPNQKPVHPVKITKPFYMGIYPVTVAEYEMLMATVIAESEAKRGPTPLDKVHKYWAQDTDGIDFLSPKPDPKTPIVLSSWNLSMGLITELNKREPNSKYRFPTEAEWEYACRAGTEGSYFFGGDSSRLDQYAWYKDNSANKHRTVGRLQPNPWGLYDMLGNVWEIVHDEYSDSFYSDCLEKGIMEDPVCGQGDFNPACRGGDYLTKAEACTCSVRYPKGHGGVRYGFRIVREVYKI
jgi:formylglycine-generating enzyme required for sulfatase activity